jgi:uncharacterized protein
MSAGPPIQIDPLDLAKQQIRLSGTYQVSDMPRLAEIVLPGPEAVTFDLQFRLEPDRKTAVLSGSISAELIIKCERCLQPLRLPLELLPRIYFQDSGGPAPAEPEEDERDLVEIDGPVVLRDLVEDEILLNLPMMPMHDRDQCSASRYLENTDSSEKKADSPFAQLAELKKK